MHIHHRLDVPQVGISVQTRSLEIGCLLILTKDVIEIAPHFILEFTLRLETTESHYPEKNTLMTLLNKITRIIIEVCHTSDKILDVK